MDDAAYIVGLMKTETDALGFIPEPAIRARWINRGDYIIPRSRRGPRRGYLLHGPPRRGLELRVYQVCIDYDWRRRAHATDAVRQLVARARRAGARGVTLRCAADLDANHFWLAMGFSPIRVDFPANRRCRAIITYRRDLRPSLLAPRPTSWAPAPSVPHVASLAESLS